MFGNSILKRMDIDEKNSKTVQIFFQSYGKFFVKNTSKHSIIYNSTILQSNFDATLGSFNSKLPCTNIINSNYVIN